MAGNTNAFRGMISPTFWLPWGDVYDHVNTSMSGANWKVLQWHFLYLMSLRPTSNCIIWYSKLHATLLTQHTFAADIEYCRLKGYTISGSRYGITSYRRLVMPTLSLTLHCKHFIQNSSTKKGKWKKGCFLFGWEYKVLVNNNVDNCCRWVSLSRTGKMF